mgnify:CR=1 FL=1
MENSDNELADLRICVEKTISSDTSNGKKLTAAFMKQKIWPQNSTIKIQFLSDPPIVGSGKSSNTLLWTPQKNLQGLIRSDGTKPIIDPLDSDIRKLKPVDAVKKVITERLQPLVNLNFKFVDSGGDVRIDFIPGKGSWSLLGTDCKLQPGQTLNFGWLDCATIIHEFGHVLGLIHEHQNPFGQGIPWNREKVYSWAAQTQGWDRSITDTNILNRYNTTQLNGSAFDPYSIMLYFFPAELTMDNKGTDPNEILSKTDIEYISKTYPKNSPVNVDSEFVGNKPTNSSGFKNIKFDVSPLLIFWFICIGILFLIFLWYLFKALKITVFDLKRTETIPLRRYKRFRSKA